MNLWGDRLGTSFISKALERGVVKSLIVGEFDGRWERLKPLTMARPRVVAEIRRVEALAGGASWFVCFCLREIFECGRRSAVRAVIALQLSAVSIRHRPFLPT